MRVNRRKTRSTSVYKPSSHKFLKDTDNLLARPALKVIISDLNNKSLQWNYSGHIVDGENLIRFTEARGPILIGPHTLSLEL